MQCSRYEGLSHTDPIIEGPIGGGQDRLLEDIFSIVSRGSLTKRHLIGDFNDVTEGVNNFVQKPMAYNWQIRFARFVNPF